MNAGGGSASIAVVLAYFSRPKINSDRTRAIAVHIALVFSLVLMVVFGWRAKLAWTVPEKRYLSYLLSVMGIGSFVALAHLVCEAPLFTLTFASVRFCIFISSVAS
jgi:hypothetical protein